MKYGLLFLVMSLSIVGCGETPTSQLREEFPILRSGPHDMEFAFIPRGTFRMGSPEGEEGRVDNESRHWVKLTEDYWMQTKEVTRGQWFKVMGSYPGVDGNCYKWAVIKKEENHPIVCVNTYDIQSFIDKLNNNERGSGYKYDLPTEAQWEYAARAYAEGAYSVNKPVNSFAWHSENTDLHTEPVGGLEPNLFGLYDVHGNVWERVSDWFESYDYPKENSFLNPVIDPKGPEDATQRVVRGGGYSNREILCRSATRDGSQLDYRESTVGFRLRRTKI